MGRYKYREEYQGTKGTFTRLNPMGNQCDADFPRFDFLRASDLIRAFSDIFLFHVRPRKVSGESFLKASEEEEAFGKFEECFRRKYVCGW